MKITNFLKDDIYVTCINQTNKVLINPLKSYDLSQLKITECPVIYIYSKNMNLLHLITNINYEKNIIVGKQLFVKTYKYFTSFQKSTTQGLNSINIHNHYLSPITVNGITISPGFKLGYRGPNALGIQLGELIESTYDVTFPLTDKITDIYFGLL